MIVETAQPARVTLPRVLIADDQSDVQEALRLLLRAEGYDTHTVSSPAAALDALGASQFDILLMDLNYARDTTSGREGLDLLARVRERDPMLPIVVMTAWGTVDLAVEAMKSGVGDFVEKPWDNTRLIHVLRAQLEQGRARRDALARLERQKRELEEAQAMQRALLPKEFPRILGFQIAGAWQPMRGVGGDYFDFFALGDGVHGLCIGDVMGKGMPAALLMSNLQATVRGCASAGISPAELCARVNVQICRNTDAEKFITFFYARLDARGRRLAYSNAGHNQPIAVRQNGAIERLREGGAVLGMFPAEAYAEGDVELGSGDRVALFTDGITECRNAQGDEFGELRLVELLREHSARSAEELHRMVMAAVGNWSGGEFQDDATLIVIGVE